MITQRKTIAEIADAWKQDKKAFVKLSTYSAFPVEIQIKGKIFLTFLFRAL